MTRKCPDCGTPLTCHACRQAKVGARGGKVTSEAKTAAARRASRMPRPGRRAFLVAWDGRAKQERMTVSQASRVAVKRGIGGGLLDGGRLVGRVEPDGTYRIRE